VSQTDQIDLLDVYERASGWTAVKVKGATRKLDLETPCDEWDVRTLLNHMLDTQRYFTGAARGEDASPPSPAPPNLLGDDPVATFAQSRSDLMRAFREPGAIEKTGPALGIACADQLLHGWDLAKATGQDASATMPEGLPALAYDMIHVRFSDDQRQGVFKPAVKVAPDASAQDKLVAYTGRDPAS
jgi:uncharacterized protein (TIGR03086 family)